MNAASGDYTYQGDELGLAAAAQNWKAYFRKALAPYVRGRVVEVGAGLGGTTEVLSKIEHASWNALEPDAALLAEIRKKLERGVLPDSIVPTLGTLNEIAPEALFDTILYIDVLEHIEDDKAELDAAAKHLERHGHLIVLSPAFQSLYTEFDAEIGHFRRYRRTDLAQLTPHPLQLRTSFYLDSLGACTSLANRLFLRQSMPTLRQVQFWDRYLVPCSTVLDKLVGKSVGKSVVAIWQRP